MLDSRFCLPWYLFHEEELSSSITFTLNITGNELCSWILKKVIYYSSFVCLTFFTLCYPRPRFYWPQSWVRRRFFTFAVFIFEKIEFKNLPLLYRVRISVKMQGHRRSFLQCIFGIFSRHKRSSTRHVSLRIYSLAYFSLDEKEWQILFVVKQRHILIGIPFFSNMTARQSMKQHISIVFIAHWSKRPCYLLLW